jgi:polar amino acid transport system permease protein
MVHLVALLLDVGPFHVPWRDYVGELATAALQTIEFTVAGFVGAGVIGLLVAILRLSPFAPARAIARIYTEVFKNLPLVTEIFMVYFGLATIGLVLNVFTAGAISLAIFYGAYLSEIFRGGLQGVTKGQREAAQAVGFSPVRAFGLVILPQATRLALPGTSTMLVDLLKGTSLLTFIGGAELMNEGRTIVSNTFASLEVYIVIGAIYLAMCYPLSHLALMLERHLHAGKPLSPRRFRILRLARILQAQQASPLVSI